MGNDDISTESTLICGFTLLRALFITFECFFEHFFEHSSSLRTFMAMDDHILAMKGLMMFQLNQLSCHH